MILYVGRIEPVKGLELLIKAAGELRGRSDFQLLLVGETSLAAPRWQPIKGWPRSSIAARLSFPGLVEHHHLPRYYNAAAVTVILYYESFA